MSESVYTEDQVEVKVREAVEKTERSFGGTFKRLKSENEELKTQFENVVAEHQKDREELNNRVVELEESISQSSLHISELAIQGELHKQLKEKGPLPERFIDVGSIAYSDDEEIFRANVAEAVDKGRREFEQLLSEHGISLPNASHHTVNPTNPPTRDTATAHNMKNAEARDALHDMVRRGLIR